MLCHDAYYRVLKQGNPSPKHLQTQDIISSIHEHLENYHYTKHAKNRLRSRGISQDEVDHILRAGVHEKGKDRFLSAQKSWSYSIAGRSYTDKNIRVIIEFSNGLMTIVTVIDNGKYPSKILNNNNSSILRGLRGERFNRFHKIPKIKNLLQYTRNYLRAGNYRYSQRMRRKLNQQLILNRDIEGTLLYGKHQRQYDYLNEEANSWNYVIAGKDKKERRLWLVVRFDSHKMIIDTILQ